VIVGVNYSFISEYDCFDINWHIMSSDNNSSLTISAGIKTLYGIGAIRSMFCVDFMDVISTLKNASHNTIEFVSLSSSKNISHLTGQLKYNIDILVDSVKCIFLFIYLSTDFKIETNEMCKAIANIHELFGSDVDLLLGCSHSKSFRTPIIRDEKNVWGGMMVVR
jgi:hypothetical protein